MTNPTGRQFKRIDYGQIAEEYEVSRRVPEEFKTQIIQQIIEKTELSNQTLLLELGCGTGRLIRDFTKQGILVIYLKYNEDKSPVIKGLKRISKPRCRIYSRCKKIPSVLNGLGINIVSTSKGVVTGREARRLGVGGEIICSVW